MTGTSDKDAGSLVQQIRSFNRQQFAGASEAGSRALDVESLLQDSDDDDDDDQQQQQHQQQHSDDDGDDDYDDKASEFAAHSITGYESEDEVDEEEEAAFAMMNQLQLLQTRTVRKSALAIAISSTSSSAVTGAALTQKGLQARASSVSAGMELTQAEERIAQLETQLLDAEETIYHLKAEKLTAFRDVERLTIVLQKKEQQSLCDDEAHNNSNNNNNSSSSDKETTSVNIWRMQSASSDGEEEKPEQLGVDSDDNESNSLATDLENEQKLQTTKELRAKVRLLEERLVAQQESQSLEQEEHMAVIREQELEIQRLKLDLERMTETCEDLQSQLYRAFHADSPVAVTSLKRAESLAFSTDGDVDADDDKDIGFLYRRTLGGLNARRSSSSVDSSTSFSPGSESSETTAEYYPQWREELVRHPTPHFDLDSPEVHYLLHSWTANLQKLHYLRMWFAQVVTTRGPLAEDFPLGVELPRLAPEIRDGFLTLVVPLLRKQTQRDVQVHARQYNDQYHTDLRIRVVQRKR